MKACGEKHSCGRQGMGTAHQLTESLSVADFSRLFRPVQVINSFFA
jgi:hypothetical protein